MYTFITSEKNEHTDNGSDHCLSEFNGYIQSLEVDNADAQTRNTAIKALAALISKGMRPKDSEEAGRIMQILFPHPVHHTANSEHLMLAEKARGLVNAARKLPYPEGYEVSPWWAAKQNNFMRFCSLLANPVDIVSFAQCTHLSGSDRRIYGERPNAGYIIMEQLKQIEQIYGKCVPTEYTVEDSEFSIQSSLYKIADKWYSNSFLNMFGYYLGSVHSLPFDRNIASILEIGAGYGSLARIIKLLHPEIQYTIVDLPETLLLSYIFISLNFPSAKKIFLTRQDDYDVLEKEEYDFIFVPAQLCPSLYGRKYELVINTGSLQEMPIRTTEYLLNIINNRIEADFFYSFNYFINARSVLREWSGADPDIEFSNMCPQLDPWWNVLSFRFNPLHLTVDSKGRNWLELLVERIKREERNSINIQNRATSLMNESEKYPVMSDKWLEHLWQAIRMDSSPEYIRKMINGLELFTKGWHRPNHMFSGKFGAPAGPDASWEYREALFSRIDEVNYYNSLMVK
jgi:putative sugar O-methyltransferase